MASINNINFAYPILCKFNDDFVDVEFIGGSTGDLSKTSKKSTIKISTTITDKKLLKMLKDDQIKIITKVYCATTKFRKIYDIKLGMDEIVLNNRDVNKRVDFQTFIIANQDIKGYSSPNFNEDYKDLTFEIEKGSILAIGKEEYIFMEKEIDDLTKVDSVIKVKNSGKENEASYAEYDDDFIKINLNSHDYRIYSQYSKYSIPIVNSMIIIPNIMDVLDKIVMTDDDSYKEKKWYRVIARKIEQVTGKEFSFEYIKNHGSFEILQKIFDNPITDAMEEIERKWGGDE